MKKYASPNYELLPNEEMTFEVEPDSYGDLCLLAGCHKDGETKVYTRIRLDQLSCAIRSRNELIDFIDAYVRDKKSEDIFIPKEEQKFRLGFSSENGEPVLYASIRVKNGFVHTDRISLSALSKHQRSVKTFEDAIIDRNNL